MTKQTDTRILRDLIGGILTAFSIDNLELEIKLCEAYKRFYDSPEPRKTKDEMLAGLQRGASKVLELKAIEDEIIKRVRINPTTPAWIEFIGWANAQNRIRKESITIFLDWWLSDEWQRAHPPSKPDIWYVKWMLAFPEETQAENISQPTASGGFR